MTVILLRIIDLDRFIYYYNIRNRTKVEDTNEDVKKNKGSRLILSYHFNKNGNRICDEQIKEYILEIIKREGLCYEYYKTTINSVIRISNSL